ncbi:MAG TPA: class I SAM-dependent methyltransferase [Gaiellaceae bacterium]|nr:class I SAM-dependent methyltransferase [Gaiellaceae bacterium]
MPTVQELYELWATEAYPELKASLEQSLEPRGLESLRETFASLDPQPGQVVVDIGARDAVGAIRLAQQHGLRAVAVDPVPLHCERARQAVAEAGLEDRIEVVEGAIEDLPLADASVDWIWCRDVLVHVDVRRGLAECERVLRPGGAMVAHVTLATERLEPREAAELAALAAIVPESFTAAAIEAAAAEAGFITREEDVIGSEWRERALEDGDWDAAGTLLAIARLDRQRPELVEHYGAIAVDVARNGFLWGIYQLLGKLCPTVYVWSKTSSA